MSKHWIFARWKRRAMLDLKWNRFKRFIRRLFK